jgi:hypothetical protein
MGFLDELKEKENMKEAVANTAAARSAIDDPTEADTEDVISNFTT